MPPTQYQHAPRARHSQTELLLEICCQKVARCTQHGINKPLCRRKETLWFASAVFMVFQVQPCLTINPLTGLSTQKTQQLPNASTHQPANTRTHKLNNSQPPQTYHPTLLVSPSTCQLVNQRAHQPTILVNSPTCQLVNLSTRQPTNPPTHHSC